MPSTPAPRYQLAFCIPTLNFGEFIGETLASIVAQADDRVQIVVVDGGSTDNTREIVTEWTQRFPHIAWHQRTQRMGIDRDILETVARADAEWCWLFSSDDVLAPGSIARVREEFSTGCNALLVNHALCNRTLQPVRLRDPLSLERPESFDFGDPVAFERYCGLARGDSTGFFSFISAMLVRRDDWLAAGPQEQFLGSCWIIAAQLWAMARHRLVLRYVPDPLLAVRLENDSFLSQGLVRRIGLSLEGFRQVAGQYLGAESPAYRQVERVLHAEFPFWHLMRLRRGLSSAQDRQGFDRLMRLHYHHGGLRSRLARTLLTSPAWAQQGTLWLAEKFRLARQWLRRLAARPRVTAASTP